MDKKVILSLFMVTLIQKQTKTTLIRAKIGCKTLRPDKQQYFEAIDA